MRRVEKIQICQLGWLKAHVEDFADEGWYAQVAASIQQCIDAYDNAEDGNVVEYHLKVFGGIPAGRMFASCGMQSLYKPFRAAIARTLCSSRTGTFAIATPPYSYNSAIGLLFSARC